MLRSALPHSAFAALFLILSLVQYLSHNLGLIPRKKLQGHSASCQARYLRLYPNAGFCFASTGRTTCLVHITNMSTIHRNTFFIPAEFRQNPAFGFSNRDALEKIMADSSRQSFDLLASVSSASQRSVDMFGVLMDSLTADSASNTPISPPRPKNLTAIFSGIGNQLDKFRSSSQKQNLQLTVSQESTDLLFTPQKNTSTEVISPASTQKQANNGVDQFASEADSPIVERPRRNILRPHLYQSSEEAKKEKEYRKKFYRRSPHAHRKKKHPPHAKPQEYRVFRMTTTRTSSQEKPSPDVLSAPT